MITIYGMEVNEENMSIIEEKIAMSEIENYMFLLDNADKRDNALFEEIACKLCKYNYEGYFFCTVLEKN